MSRCGARASQEVTIKFNTAALQVANMSSRYAAGLLLPWLAHFHNAAKASSFGKSTEKDSMLNTEALIGLGSHVCQSTARAWTPQAKATVALPSLKGGGDAQGYCSLLCHVHNAALLTHFDHETLNMLSGPLRWILAQPSQKPPETPSHFISKFAECIKAPGALLAGAKAE